MEEGEQIIQATEYLKSLGICLGLGMLVGLQREWEKDRIAGIRTFPLVSLVGGLSAVIAANHGGWVIAAGMAGCVVFVVMANVASWRVSGKPSVGLTTEFALLAMFAIGVVAVMHHWMEAIVCSGVVMVLLHGKTRMHGWVRRFDAGELKEIAKLVLMGLVILPLLPNQDMGYLDVINPFEIWLMVVLIVGVTLAAFLASKFIGGQKGALLSGVLGGLISSTATTAGVSRRSKATPNSSGACALIAMVATAIVFVRVIVEMFFAAGEAGRPMVWPMAVMLGWSGLIVGVMWWRGLGRKEVEQDEEAPSELKAAIIFALLYVAVLCGVAFAKQRLGDAGLYAVAAISGLTDMDAITLSTSKLVADGHIDTGQGWRLILLGGVANMVFKAGMVAVLADRRMLWPILLAFGATSAGAAALWVLWPG